MVVNIGFDPVLLRLGALQLGWHGLFTVVAVAVAVWLGTRRAIARGVPEAPLWDLVVWAIVGGIIGARLFHVLDHASYFAAHPLKAFAVWEGGIAVYGAFLGGIVGGFVSARRDGLPVWTLLDAAAPAMLVAQMIGRLGCLSNGDAWGRPTGAAWGVAYQNPGDLLPAQLLGVPTHPYPVYEIAAVALLLGVLWAGRRHLGVPGSTFLVAAVGYAMIRFGLTFFRQETLLLWGLQEAQLVALGTGLLALGLLAYRRRSVPSRPPRRLPA